MKAEFARRARQPFPLDRWFQVIEIRDQIEASFSDRRTSRPASLLKFVGQKQKSEAENRRGLHPNFPPVISRVRRLFSPLLGRVVCGFGFMFIAVFPAALHSLREAEKLSGFGSEAGAHCT
ncbi:MAG: hypothetical protein WAL68_07205, partial [Candidatus Binatus sp.]